MRQVSARRCNAGNRERCNVAYGVPKYTATRNNKLLVVSFLAKSLLFRVAVHFGPPYPTLYLTAFVHTTSVADAPATQRHYVVCNLKVNHAKVVGLIPWNVRKLNEEYIMSHILLVDCGFRTWGLGARRER